MSKKDSQFPHLWIPEGEIVVLDNEPTGRRQPVNIHHVEHGTTLMEGLDRIQEIHSHQDSSLEDEVIVFKVKLQEGEKFDNALNQKIFETNKIQINSLKDSRTAVVSSKPGNVNAFKSKVNEYILHNRFKTSLPYIELILNFGTA